MATDPVLKQLVADATAAQATILLDLYLPSGRVIGRMTGHEGFGHWATVVLNRESAFTGTVEPARDPEYVHLSVTEPLSDADPDIVRVRLADVVAWTVG